MARRNPRFWILGRSDDTLNVDGEIMRRIIRAKAPGQDPGDTSPLEHPRAVDEIPLP